MQSKCDISKLDEGYLIASTPEFKNMPSWSRQEMKMTKEYKPEWVHIYDNNNDVAVKISFTKVEFNPTFADNYFDVDANMSESRNNLTQSSSSVVKELPLYPVNADVDASLKEVSNITINNGTQVMLTYSGKQGFTVLESNAKSHEELVVEEINIKLLWKSFSLLNYITEIKLRYKRIYNRFWFRKYLPLFDSYDLDSAHYGDCGEIALEIYKKYKIPYCVTWHGSDIHTSPFNNKYVKQKTINILENAYQNFFVSDNLKEVSEILIKNNSKELLYNWVSEIFKKYSYELREEFRKQLGAQDKKVVAFVGNLFDIKNVLLLPEIFSEVINNYEKI